jgi:hypothetical protein
MKIKSAFSVFHLKPIVAFAFITLGLAFFNQLNAQSIIGKWNGVSVKNYYSADYAKVTGKPMEEKTAKEIGQSSIEYKSDHTYILSFTPVNDSKATIMKGSWVLNGDQLQSTFEAAYNPRHTAVTTTVLVTGNTMVTTSIIAPPSRITKSISISTRM